MFVNKIWTFIIFTCYLELIYFYCITVYIYIYIYIVKSSHIFSCWISGRVYIKQNKTRHDIIADTDHTDTKYQPQTRHNEPELDLNRSHYGLVPAKWAKKTYVLIQLKLLIPREHGRHFLHSDVTMSIWASRITGESIVCLRVCLD